MWRLRFLFGLATEGELGSEAGALQRQQVLGAAVLALQRRFGLERSEVVGLVLGHVLLGVVLVLFEAQRLRLDGRQLAELVVRLGAARRRQRLLRARRFRSTCAPSHYFQTNAK